MVSASRKLRESPLANLYLAGHHEVAGISEIADRVLDEADEGLPADRLDAVHRALRRAAGQEISRLERYLPFLATTASAAPFIGLFGTVWGVITAFHGIGQQGSASLAVVAPGISEALIATAAGLGAAIPAVMGYNFFVNRVRHWGTEMDGFMFEFLNVLCRPAPTRAATSQGCFKPEPIDGGGRRPASSLAEINIIPLVDVVLVLLLIFMLTAPMMYRGIDVNLPKAAAKPTAVEERMVLTVTKDRTLYLNDKPVPAGVPGCTAGRGVPRPQGQDPLPEGRFRSRIRGGGGDHGPGPPRGHRAAGDGHGAARPQ